MPTTSSHPQPTRGKMLRRWAAVVALGVIELIRAGISARTKAIHLAPAALRDI